MKRSQFLASLPGLAVLGKMLERHTPAPAEVEFIRWNGDSSTTVAWTTTKNTDTGTGNTLYFSPEEIEAMHADGSLTYTAGT